MSHRYRSHSETRVPRLHTRASGNTSVAFTVVEKPAPGLVAYTWGPSFEALNTRRSLRLWPGRRFGSLGCCRPEPPVRASQESRRAARAPTAASCCWGVMGTTTAG